ncbi:hypothetical protein B0A55_02266 [Friedmanniomyces simplex]|uniref:Uncharacterized protein n=1 Tax=Friedmanniomyces simplex TaxID=329884 RepID=A0A4U0XPN8_9PEZI|nr:hypothetical protein B0A55_02266 [Friedmanniomyces simplex]
MAALAPLLTPIGTELTHSPHPHHQTLNLPTWTTTSLTPQHPRPIKRLAPGLELRLQQLEELKRRRERERRRQSSIGRIPEEQLAELERLHGTARQAIEVRRRRGNTYSFPPVRVPMPAAGGVRLDGAPMLSEAETSCLGESDASSIISISERLAASDTEEDEGGEEDGLRDTHKYRMPTPGKTRLHLHTKEPLSPTPRSTRRRVNVSTPTTPTSGRRGSKMALSPSLPTSPRQMDGGHAGNGSDSDFISSGVSRAGSVYSLSRVSFTGQLSQLTNMRLPDAESLAKRISSIPSSTEAAKVLSDAAEQIRMWVTKASEVLSGLDGQDDVEWAAAGGRDGIEDVDSAISRFDKLVQVYIMSIERLQTRADVSDLSAEELMFTVKQMESIIASWQKVKQTLKGVKEQVEIAMEWEELWNSVLGEIGQELEGLNRLVFEMEERRHEGAESLWGGKASIDLSELETIVEERPGSGPAARNNRFSFPPFSPSSPIQASAQDGKDDSSLLALFARMQPLRASLDFMPMRLSVFHCRGNSMFPSACLDLESRRDQLEEQWKKLETDAEALRRELGEDRWVLVFRNAGRQALKMCESISRSYTKLRDGVDTGEQLKDGVSFSKRVENYEAKKTHYGPAIERVLAIIDRGVLDRLTVNGEILRLQSDMKRRWSALQADMRDLDLVLEDVNNERYAKQLRDSVSTVVSSERSVSSSIADTRSSSPASSVMIASRKSSFQGSRTPTPLINAKTRQASGMRSSGTAPASRQASSSSIPRRAPFSRNPTSDFRDTASPSPSLAATRIPMQPEAPPSNRPRWVAAMKTENRGFLPLSTLEPSPYAKTPATPKTNYLRAQSRVQTTPASAPARAGASSRMASTPPSLSPRPPSSAQPPTRKSSLPVPTLHASSPLAPRSAPLASRPVSRAVGSGRRSSVLDLPLVRDGNEADSESSPLHSTAGPEEVYWKWLPEKAFKALQQQNKDKNKRKKANQGSVRGMKSDGNEYKHKPGEGRKQQYQRAPGELLDGGGGGGGGGEGKGKGKEKGKTAGPGSVMPTFTNIYEWLRFAPEGPYAAVPQRGGERKGEEAHGTKPPRGEPSRVGVNALKHDRAPPLGEMRKAGEKSLVLRPSPRGGPSKAAVTATDRDRAPPTSGPHGKFHSAADRKVNGDGAMPGPRVTPSHEAFDVAVENWPSLPASEESAQVTPALKAAARALLAGVGGGGGDTPVLTFPGSRVLGHSNRDKETGKASLVVAASGSNLGAGKDFEGWVVVDRETETGWAQQSAIVNGTLYLYGGEATTEPGQTSDTWNNDFLTMDLTKTWPISSPSLTGLPQPSGPPAVSLGYLWNSYDSLFLYGGEYSWKPVVSPDPMAVWEYDIQSQSWIEHSDPTTSSGVNAQSNGDPVQRSAEGAGVSVPFDVYDIASSTWYKQATSGPSPTIRVNPCAAMAAAPDGSSYNIYMFGGQNLTPYGNQSQFDDMWILTLPSFTWIEVDQSKQSVPYGRSGHTCNYSWKPVVSPDPMAVWEYDIQSQSWIEHSDPTTSSGVNAQSNVDPVQRSAEGAGVSVPSLGRGFYFGGHQDGYTTAGWSQSIARIYLQSLLEFTFPGYANNQVNALGSGKTAGTDGNYRNITSAGLQADAGFTMRADGVLIYVPGFGDQGILLALAGGTNVTYTQMNNIDVYDIASSTWYKQATSGPSPTIRVNPCAAMAAAPDGSSYNIYMFGGQNLTPYGNQSQFDDMWILTLPSFTWIEVDQSKQSVPYGRSGHTCNVWDGQMVVVGGYVGDQLSCDSPGIYVFDMSNAQWVQQFTALSPGASSSGGSSSVSNSGSGSNSASASGSTATASASGSSSSSSSSTFNSTGANNPLNQQPAQLANGTSAGGIAGSYGYVVPQIVIDVIGGGPSGGATVTVPAVTATGGPLATGKPITYTVTQPNGAVVTETGTSGSPNNNNNNNGSPNHHSGPNIAAIVIGVVCGLLFLLASYLAFCAYVYRRQLQLYKRHVEMSQAQARGEKVPAIPGLLASDSAKTSSDRPPVVGGQQHQLGGMWSTSESASQAGSGNARSGYSGGGQTSAGSSGGGRQGAGGGGGGGGGGLLAGGYQSVRRDSDRSSVGEDILDTHEPTFVGVLLNPRRSLKVVNRD